VSFGVVQPYFSVVFGIIGRVSSTVLGGRYHVALLREGGSRVLKQGNVVIVQHYG
jgi:hypothetical protein